MLKIRHNVVMKPYHPALQDVWTVESLERMKISPLDWVIVADIDEFYTFGEQNLKDMTASMQQEGSTYAIGQMLDHIAVNGTLTAIQVRSCLLLHKTCQAI